MMQSTRAMTASEMEIEIQVLNEALREAEELTSAMSDELELLRRKSRLLENRLISYGISFDDIVRFLDAE